MNFGIILYIVGWILKIAALLMVIPLLTALAYGESAGFTFLITMAISLALGILLGHKKPKNQVFYTREGYVTVAISWLMLSIVGCLPFVFSGSIPHFVDALFETVSGFTTTGASILSDVEALPKCMLMWRSFTHWIGGMGILVFILCVMPLTGGYQMNLMKAESPGPSVGRLVPKVRTTAVILYQIYMVLTLLQVMLLLLGRIPLFDALYISMGTAGTGGFGALNDSMASYSTYIQVVITVFMTLFGVNFGVYYLISTKKFKSALLVEELRYYLLIQVAAIAMISVNVRHLFPNLLTSVQQSAFQVSSIMTTTGYSTTDFDLWPSFSKTILVILMFVGACAGSTGGGIKVARVIMLCKTIRKEILLYLHPSAVKKVKMDGKVIPHETVRNTNIFIMTYILIFAASLLLVSIDNHDMTTNFTAVAATFNNIGPGLSKVGPTCNFGLFSPGAKLVLIVDMLAGRLEIFPMLILMNPSTWTGK